MVIGGDPSTRALYELNGSYNARMSQATSKISRNGQFSLPADIRHRWGAQRVVIVDEGDYVIVRPVPADILGSLQGSYAGPGPSSERVRADERAADARHALRQAARGR